MHTIKCVVVGDGSVGKTWLIATQVSGENPKGYLPTIFDNFFTVVKINTKEYVLSIWDTAAQEEFDKLRTLSYPQTDVFMLCYAVDNVISFNNAKAKWLGELKRYEVPIVLVGNKVDKRDDAEQENDIVTKEMGEKLKDEEGLYAFLECSAIERTNVRKVFETAVEAVSNPRTAEQKKAWWKIFCCGY